MSVASPRWRALTTRLLTCQRLAGLCAAALAGSLLVAVTPTATAPAAAVGPFGVTAWVPWWQANETVQDELGAFNANASLLNEATPFFWSAESGTSIVVDPSLGTDAEPAAVKIMQWKAAAVAAGKPVVATIVDGMPARGMYTVLSTPSGRAQHVQALISFMNTGGYDGLDLDYEQFAFSDPKSTWPVMYVNWGLFIGALSDAVHAHGKTLAVSVPPVYNALKDNNSSGYWVYNYNVLGQKVDHIRIMTYSYSGNAAGVISPYWWFEQSLNAAKAIVADDSKIQMGIAAYGTDSFRVEGTCPKGVKPLRRSVTHQSAAKLVATKGVDPTWVEGTAAKPIREVTFSYVESFSGQDVNGFSVLCNVYRTVWYPNQWSLYQRVLLAKQSGVGGVAMWALGYDDPITWQAISAGVEGKTDWPQPASLPVGLEAPAILSPYPAPISSPLPARFLDTRTGSTTADGLFQALGRMNAGSTLEVKIAGRGPVPTDATGVALNVTAIGEGTGFVTVYPCGTRPTTSSLNVRAGQTIANSVITTLSATGTVCIYTQAPANLVVDVFNVLSAAAFVPLATPARLLDTRAGQVTIDGQFAGVGAVAQDTVIEVAVAARGGLASGITSAVLNVTAVGAVGNGYLTVWPCTQPRPTTSNVNYAAGGAVPNAVVTALSATGTVCVYSNNTTDVVIDVSGSFSADQYTSLAQPARLLETRAGYSTIDGVSNAVGKAAAGAITEVQVGGRGGLGAAPEAVVLNVTIDAPEVAGYITVYPCGTARPFASNVNFVPGQTIPNLVVSQLSDTGRLCIYSLVKTHIIVDVFGTLNL